MMLSRSSSCCCCGVSFVMSISSYTFCAFIGSVSFCIPFFSFSVSKPSLWYMCGSKSLCSARTSCASSLVAVVIFFKLLSCIVTALILMLGFFACSPASSGLVAACCCLVSFLLLLALPSCIWSSSDLLVVGGLLTGVGEVHSFIVVCAVSVDSPSVLCLFVSSVLAFFACVSPVGAGVVSSRCCVDLAAVTVVLSCDEAA